jgi:hypothetical protein
VTLILFRVDATSNVHQLDFNKRILMYDVSIKDGKEHKYYNYIIIFIMISALNNKQQYLYIEVLMDKA